MPIQVFGQGAVQTAYISYIPLDITDNSITLVWPSSYVDAPFVDPVTEIHYELFAAYMNVITPVLNTNVIILPNAIEVSIGQNFIIRNDGLSDFELRTSDNVLLQVVAVGIAYYGILQDNSTQAGTWKIDTFGAGTSQASAAALAGNGLVAIVDRLNTNVPVISTNIPFTVDSTYRAKLVVWIGGVGTITLPVIATAPAGFYFSVNNEGGATITIDAGATTIDGSATQLVAQKQSLTIISDGTKWFSLGFGQNQFATISELDLNVGGNSNITLTSLQASSLIQRYNGLLTGNITVFFPPSVNYWFVNNNTTGAFTLSVQTAGPIGSSIIVPQGSSMIFYSAVSGIFTSPTAISLIEGDPSTPALSFTSTPNTGIFYTPVTDPTIAFSIGGVTTGSFQKTVTLGGVSAFSPSLIPIQMTASDTTGSIRYNSVTALNINLTGNPTFPNGPLTLSSGQFLAPVGSESNPSYSFSGDQDSGMYNISSNVIGISTGGTYSARFEFATDAGVISAVSTGGVFAQLISDTLVNGARISYNGAVGINISSVGLVTLPTAPLPIGSGGTNATAQAQAIKNLMPSAIANGTLAYYDGTNWVILSPPAVGGTPTAYLIITKATGNLSWSDI